MSISSIIKTTEQQSYCHFILAITLKEKEAKEKGHDISHDKHNSLCKMIKSKKCIQQITRTRLKQNYNLSIYVRKNNKLLSNLNIYAF